MAIRYRYWYFALGIISIISQTGSLTVLIDAISRDNTTLNIMIIVALMETVVLITQGIDKFYNFGAGSEKYFDAVKEHDALKKFIDLTLSLPRKDRDNARETLLSIKKQFEDIRNNSPIISYNKIVHKLDMCIYENPEIARGMSTQARGLSEIPTIVQTMSPQQMEKGLDKHIELPVAHDLHNNQLLLTFKKQEPDEELISHQTMNNVKTKLLKSKLDASTSLDKRNFNLFEYQWKRLEEHNETDV